MCGLKSQLLLGDEDNVRSQAFLDRSLLFLAYLPQYQILVVFFKKKEKSFQMSWENWNLNRTVVGKALRRIYRWALIRFPLPKLSCCFCFRGCMVDCLCIFIFPLNQLQGQYHCLLYGFHLAGFRETGCSQLYPCTKRLSSRHRQ